VVPLPSWATCSRNPGTRTTTMTIESINLNVPPSHTKRVASPASPTPNSTSSFEATLQQQAQTRTRDSAATQQADAGNGKVSDDKARNDSARDSRKKHASDSRHDSTQEASTT